jgi:hypothetical protein
MDANCLKIVTIALKIALTSGYFEICKFEKETQ